MSTQRRGGVLEFAILGLLHDNPMHGYELRKRLNAVLGTFRAISYGSLYPTLRTMLDSGLITEAGPADASAPALSGKRARIVYELTADGKERFAELTAETGPESWEDETFGVRMAFFGRTSADARMRILQGRRSRLEERMSNLRESMTRGRERIDNYTQELQRHGLEGVEREVRWLSELIDSEAAGTAGNSQSNTNPTGKSGAGPRPSARG
ncbi:MAG: PadR family transcriptional regulator [Candidatus Nanopelagicales bacterium]